MDVHRKPTDQLCLHDASFGVPELSSLPRHHNNPLAKCGCKKHCMDFHGDHTAPALTQVQPRRMIGW
jgi:hypothetical protein